MLSNTEYGRKDSTVSKVETNIYMSNPRRLPGPKLLNLRINLRGGFEATQKLMPGRRVSFRIPKVEQSFRLRSCDQRESQSVSWAI